MGQYRSSTYGPMDPYTFGPSPRGVQIGHGNSFTASGYAWRAAPRGRPRPSPVGEGRSSHQPHSPAAVRRSIFSGVIGYDETVVPQLVNALLSKHNFILLGLRGQAKTRLLRGLATLLDEAIPVVPGCEIHDDPFAPLCAACRARVAADGDALPIGGWIATTRYVEKLATPDVTIADMHRRHRSDQGRARRPPARRRTDDALRAAAASEPRDLRDQRAAGSGRQDSGRPLQHPPGRRRPDQGLPRAPATGRPDGLHGESRGLHGARQDHHAAQGSHRLRDPHALRDDTPAWRWRSRHRKPGRTARASPARSRCRSWVREVVEEVAFQARADRRIDKRSGVSQRMPISVSRPSRATPNADRWSRARRPSSRACRYLRRAAVDDGQVRAGIRRRASRAPTSSRGS